MSHSGTPASMNTSTVVHRLQAPPRARAQARCSLTRANQDGVAVCTGTSTPEAPSAPAAGPERARAPAPACSAGSCAAPAGSGAPAASPASAAFASAPARAALHSVIQPGHHNQSSTASVLPTALNKCLLPGAPGRPVTDARWAGAVAGPGRRWWKVTLTTLQTSTRPALSGCTPGQTAEASMPSQGTFLMQISSKSALDVALLQSCRACAHLA